MPGAYHGTVTYPPHPHAQHVRPWWARRWDAAICRIDQWLCAHPKLWPLPGSGLRPFTWWCQRCWRQFDGLPRRRRWGMGRPGREGRPL